MNREFLQISKGQETTVGLSKKGVVARGCEVPGVEVAL